VRVTQRQRRTETDRSTDVSVPKQRVYLGKKVTVWGKNRLRSREIGDQNFNFNERPAKIKKRLQHLV